MKLLKSVVLFAVILLSVFVIVHIGHAEALVVSPKPTTVEVQQGQQVEQQAKLQEAAQVALQAGVQAAKQSFLAQVSMEPDEIVKLMALYAAFNAFMGLLQKTLEGAGGKSTVGSSPAPSLGRRLLGYALFAVRLLGGNL